jgi:transposase
MISRDEFQILYDQGPDAVYAVLCAMQAQIGTLAERVRELEARLNKDSHNSSKPPSSDGLARRPSAAKPAPRSLRPQKGRKPGGQHGHPGRTLSQVEEPDTVLLHAPASCSACGHSLEGAAVVVVSRERRQVFDLPPMRLLVTEHQALECECPDCHVRTKASFPEAVAQPVQYGPALMGLAVYLTEYQLLPLWRTQQLLADLFGSAPCEGTLVSALGTCFETLAPVESAIKESIVQAPVAHFDETGIRVQGRLHWLHVASTPDVASTPALTWYARHPKRWREAIRDLDILPRFGGVSVHDAYVSYQSEDYPCSHALCNAHLLRELTGLWETSRQTWTKQMMALLCCLKRAKEAAQAGGRQSLEAALLHRFTKVYRQIVERGLRLNPRPEPSGRKGRPARGPARSLLERLQTHESAVLRFAFDFQVPFDNNLAERDLRTTKVRLKISGCFRHESGADQFCRIRGYISTLRKQGKDVMGALRALFTGNVLYPALESA